MSRAHWVHGIARCDTLKIMKVFIAADHRGYKMKNELVRWLKEEGYEVADMGASEYKEEDDYPDYGMAVAQEVARRQVQGEKALGIVICGSGAGMAVVANKVKGIRAALIHDPAVAAAARQDDQINVLALGADFVRLDTARKIIEAYLVTPFAPVERHQRRLKKISQYEHENSCPCRQEGTNDGA